MSSDKTHLRPLLKKRKKKFYSYLQENIGDDPESYYAEELVKCLYALSLIPESQWKIDTPKEDLALSIKELRQYLLLK